MSKPERKRLFVDKQVQGAVLWRFLVYWFSCMLFMMVPLLIGRTYLEPERLLVEQVAPVWKQYWPVLAMATLLVPFLLYDTLRVTNRFAGPIYRIRQELRKFAEGSDIEPIRFRKNDYWQELAEHVNQLVHRVKEAERRACETTTIGTDHEEAESSLTP